MNTNRKRHHDWMILVSLLKEIQEEKKITEDQLLQKAFLTRASMNRFFAFEHEPRMSDFLNMLHTLNIKMTLEDEDGKVDLAALKERALDALDKLPEELIIRRLTITKTE